MSRALLFHFVAFWVAFHPAAFGEADHGGSREVPTGAGSKSSYTEKLALAQGAASYLFGKSPDDESTYAKRCASCHQSQEPRQKQIHYTVTVAKKLLSQETVVVDFDKLDGSVRDLFTELEKLVPYLGEGKRVTLGKTESYRLLTAIHRTGIHFKTAEDKAAVQKVRTFLAEFTNLTESVQGTYLRFGAPFPDVELRHRAAQVFAKGKPPEFMKTNFTNMGVALGVPAETMKKWIDDASKTEITADEDR